MEHIWLLIFSAVGFLISFYVWYKHNFKKEKLVCMIGNDCAKVIDSKYGKIFGISQSVMGIFYFGFIFIAGLMYFLFPEFFALNYAFLGKIIITGIAALFSIYSIFLQFFILKELCEYCLSLSALGIAIFLIIVL
ncbi:MAG: hypothetical protein IIA85_01720 [Nanoarchaeota archaeon]|nr:hypothetical protein [Nanoarchaeota archaeon]